MLRLRAPVLARPGGHRPSTSARSQAVTVRAAAGSATSVSICTNKECKRFGARKSLAWFEELVPEGVELEDADCFGECAMGPNVQADGRMFNGVKTKADVAKILEENCAGGEGLMAQVAAEE